MGSRDPRGRLEAKQGIAACKPADFYRGHSWACSELVSQAETRKCSNCVSWPSLNFFCVEPGMDFLNADIKGRIFFPDVTIGSYLKLEIFVLNDL